MLKTRLFQRLLNVLTWRFGTFDRALDTKYQRGICTYMTILELITNIGAFGSFYKQF